MSVLWTAKDSVRYDFALRLPPKTTSVLIPDGRVLVTAANGRVLGAFEKPWARNARGRALNTRYLLAGSVLSQVIDTTGAAFPVTADPPYT
jgi:hypothetical protein